MAKYDLTSKQKATLRKEGHVYITRNGKKIRVTPSMLKSKTLGVGRITSSGKFNVYAIGKKGEKLRAIMIADRWRITKYVQKGDQWKFLDDVEYSTAANALRDYI